MLHVSPTHATMTQAQSTHYDTSGDVPLEALALLDAASGSFAVYHYDGFTVATNDEDQTQYPIAS